MRSCLLLMLVLGLAMAAGTPAVSQSKTPAEQNGDRPAPVDAPLPMPLPGNSAASDCYSPDDGLAAYCADTGGSVYHDPNSSQRGQCVWFCRAVRPDALPSTSPSGFAKDMWNNAVANGWRTGTSPKPGSVMCFDSGGSYGSTGHVAIVTTVNGDGSVDVWESNVCESLSVGKRYVSNMGSLQGYLYAEDSDTPPILQSGCDTPIGNGSSESGHFVDCYNRNGGKANVGCPAEFGGSRNAHWWGIVVIQDFDGGSFGRGAIIDNEGVSHNTAYCVRGAIWTKYASMGSTSVLGRPTSDEMEAAPSPQGTHGRLSRFENNNSIYWCGAYGAHPTYGNIRSTYEAAGGTGSAYGFPTSDPYSWHGGIRQDFQGSYISSGADASAPSVSLTPTEIPGWYTSPQSVSWSVSDPAGLDAVQVWWNGGPVFSNSPSGSTDMLEGQQVFHVWARDAYGNAGQTDRTYHLDAVSPTVLLSGPAISTWFKTRQSISWTATDATSGVSTTTLQWDAGIPAAVQASGSVQISEGKHTASIIATDSAGNPTSESGGQWWIDTAPPVPSVALSPAAPNGDNGWYSSNPTMLCSATDPNGVNGSGVSAIYYNLDGGSETAYMAPVTITGDGIHTCLVRATDAAGNSASTGALTVRVDTTGPVFDSFYTDPQSRNLTTLVAGWNCSDPESGIAEYEYWIGTTAGDDDVLTATSTVNNWAYAMNLNLISGQTYYFTIRSKNAAGLWSAAVSSQGMQARPDWDTSPTMNAGGVSVPSEARASTNYKIVDTIGQFVVDGSSSDNYVLEHGYWHSDIAFVMVDGPGAAKTQPNGVTLQIGTTENPLVLTSSTSTFADRFYVEQADRASGIAVQYGAAGGPTLVEGDQVTLVGKTDTVSGERIMNFVSPQWIGHTEPVKPVYINVVSLGGWDANEYTLGVLDGTGLNNIGLLVTTFGGLVSYRDSQGRFFYVDNGDGLYDGSHYGMRVICDGFKGGGKLAMPAYGKHVMLTGISSTAVVSGQTVRAIRPRRQSDIISW